MVPLDWWLSGTQVKRISGKKGTKLPGTSYITIYIKTDHEQ
jgi:hypothetical protein